MSEVYALGIDIGTGSVKAVAVDHAGKVLDSAQEYYPTHLPQPSYSEQDPDVIFQAFLSVIITITARLKHEPRVIGLSSAMHSIMVTDQTGTPLTPLLLWSDSRSADIAAELRDSSKGKTIYAQTGTPIHAMSPLCKILWWKQNRPDLFTTEHKFISIKEYCWFQLFSEFVIDHSIASATGLFDIIKHKWYNSALKLAGVNKNHLSTPVPTSYTKTNANNKYVQQLNITIATPFCIGASDGCLASLGTSSIKPGHAAVTIGTSGAVRIGVKAPVVEKKEMFLDYILDEKLYICGGPVNNGGNVADWLLQVFSPEHADKNYSHLFESIARINAGSDGLVFLPYIFGERAPVWDEKATGTFCGIRSHHTKNHFIRAALEGVCFSFRQLLSDLEKITGPISILHASGGFVHSKEWVQLMCDVTGKKVLVHQQDDASAYGAAMMAMKSVGLVKSYDAFTSETTFEFQPDKSVEKVYEQNFKVFEKLYPALKNL